MCGGHWLRTDLISMRYHSEISNKVLLTYSSQHIFIYSVVTIHWIPNFLSPRKSFNTRRFLILRRRSYGEYLPLSDSPLLLILNLEWENKGDLNFFFFCKFCSRKAAKPWVCMSKGIAMNILVFSFCVFCEGGNHQSVPVYLSCYWAISCSLRLSDDSYSFFCHKGTEKKRGELFLIILVHLAPREGKFVVLWVSTKCLMFIWNAELIMEGRWH